MAQSNYSDISNSTFQLGQVRYCVVKELDKFDFIEVATLKEILSGIIFAGVSPQK